jgi:hypothetical protein
MNDQETAGAEAGISTRTMEIVVALALLALAALVVFDSYRLGARWGDDGPQSGYFPFYIGLLLGISSIATLLRVVWTERRRWDKSQAAAPPRQFVAWGQLNLVLSVLVPAFVYVLGVQLIGIYVASALYITLFMRWLGHYSWVKSAAIGVGVSASIFVLFEVWFKVPLYKGAFDALAWLGY